ncbi:hypothetical protein ABBQ38_008843 [Trebouxia sp. C0009 RCD-2024]
MQSRRLPPRLGKPCKVRAQGATKVDKSDAYNEKMKQAMGWQDADPYQYHYDRGLYYHEIIPNLLCGSQPRNVADVAELEAEVGVTTVINLQQDADFQHWGVDFGAVHQKAQELGINLIRRPAQDFDPHSLRHMLPSAVNSVYHALDNKQRVYVHCTAGLGRAPAVIIAYLFWFKDMGLDEAYKHLTDIRPCGPKRDAIRGATFDLCSGRPAHEFDHLDSNAFSGMSQHERDRLRHRVVTWGS